MKTKIYKNALDNRELFPPGKYHIHEIYEIIENNIEIPNDHYEDRPGVKYELWKNYIHGLIQSLERIKPLASEGEREWHQFT